MKEFFQAASNWVVPLLLVGIPLFAFAVKRVKVYESFIEGAKEGFWIGVKIIPYLVAILVAIGMFRASGAMGLLVAALRPVTGLIGFPPEALPVALLRPLSGSGTLGLISDLFQTFGPDSFIGRLVSVIEGSTETTFYVLAIYFGSISVRKARYALPASLLGDLTGVAAAFIVCSLLF
ncbi:spore maturation protein [candidate division FCPU426 bacterium]|nr:spore maturation protein [candidate division FCPU426 bacterium]